MIKSMTGYGRGEASDNNRKITVEVKSVNHRYLDANIKLPKKLNFFESSIRNELKKYMERGKVDIFITYEDYSEHNVAVKYNADVAADYLMYLRKMAKDFELEDDVRTSTLARFPEVFELEEQDIDEEAWWGVLSEALKKALEQFVETRLEEGAKLRDDLVSKLDGMLTHVDFIEQRSPKMIAEYKEKLRAKVAELIDDSQIDDSRLAMEVTIMSDKVCVDEELVRLRSHIEAMRKDLIAGGGVGRKLDFVAQEMNREANTTLSKCNDIEIADHAIILKTEIEKIREQIQNIE